MDYKINQINDVTQEVEFELTYSELTPHFEKAFKKFQKIAEIPGFRKGKAPFSLLKMKYGDLVEHNSLEDIANDVFRKYIQENEIKPIGEGELTEINYEPKNLFRFKVKFEILPEFELKGYKGLEITKKIHKVNDKIIDDEIKYLQSKFATYQETDKADGDEYIVTLNITRLDDTGVPIIGESRKSARFYLNDNKLSPEFREQIKDISVNEERIISISIKDSAKADKYQIQCVKTEKIIYPELNEEFFAKVYDNSIKTIDSFRLKVKSELESLYRNLEEQETINAIINELIKIHDIQVPDKMVDNILDHYIDDIRKQDPKRRLPKDFNEEEYRKTRRVDAVLEVKWFLIKEKIIENEKLEVTDEDIIKIAKTDSEKYNIPEEKLIQMYRNNSEVKHKILDDKLLKLIVDNARITENIVEE